MSWRALVLIYLIFTGSWGFLLKIALGKLDWKTVMFFASIATMTFYALFVFRDINFGLGKYHLLSLVNGILGAVSGIVLYKALSLKSASVVIPLASQYVLVTVLLSLIFLQEPITIRTVIGIICSLLSIVLLAG